MLLDFVDLLLALQNFRIPVYATFIQGEVAPLKIWIKVSLAYYRARKQDKFAKILNEICGNNDEDDAGEEKHTLNQIVPVFILHCPYIQQLQTKS